MGKRPQDQLNSAFIPPATLGLTSQTTAAPAAPARHLSGSREAMKPLYDRLLERSFPDSASAVEFCRSACAGHGFTVKQEASANKHIYVYCSREGLPDSLRKPRSSPQRKRPSKRCDCRWRVVLSETEPGHWEFRRSLNPNAAEHNHEMMSPDEMIQNWPNEVNEFIIRLARQRMQTHEIRDMVKQQFPTIAWNERRFYNRLTEERKRIRQRDVMDRSQRLLTVSARVCSLVAANEDWSTFVESEFTRLLNHYCQLARSDGDGLVSFDTDAIHIDDSQGSNSDDSSQPDDAEPTVKRRKSTASSVSGLPKGTQTVHVPGYTLFVRLQSQRGVSEATSSSSSSMYRVGRRNTASTTDQLDVNTTQSFPLASPGASSSSSSSSLMFHQYAMHHQQCSPSSPQQQSVPETVLASTPYHPIPQHGFPAMQSTTTSGPGFPPYSVPQANSFSSPSSELSFALESTAQQQSWEHHQQQQQRIADMPMHPHQFESMVMDAKQQAALFGYMPDNQQLPQHQQRTMRLNDPPMIRHPLSLQVGSTPDSMNNSVHTGDQAHWG
ncbi:hypothetical protein BJV82DRAFT_585885 [Fennellomyces sp. T-0311]|nr:hypothetical protein BJV82DRAFT_585885 [Fennellomyces sp. T-0311]